MRDRTPGLGTWKARGQVPAWVCVVIANAVTIADALARAVDPQAAPRADWWQTSAGLLDPRLGSRLHAARARLARLLQPGASSDFATAKRELPRQAALPHLPASPKELP